MASVDNNFAFNTLTDDELFELFRSPPINVALTNSSDTYDNFIADAISSSAEELQFDFLLDHL